MFKFTLIIVALIKWCIIVGMAKEIQGKIVNCNYNTSSIFRSGNDTFEPSDIDPTLCTHLTYQIDFDLTPTEEFKVSNELLHFDVGLSQGLISRVMELKIINKNLKVIAGVNFEKMKHEIYLEMAVNATKADLFIKAVLSLMIVNDFDGLDLYWKLPSKNENGTLKEINFVPVLQKFKAAFKYFKFELSISVDAATDSSRISYNIPAIVDHVDYINIKAYNFAENEYKNLVYNAPLRGQGEKNIMSVINYWIAQGAPPSKLVLGLATFGSYVKLTDARHFEIGTPVNSPNSFIGFNNLCHLKNTWTRIFHNTNAIPLLHNKKQFISYDNVKSFKLKIDFGKCVQLAGFKISAINDDDFRGACGVKYPLLSTVKNLVHFEDPDMDYCLRNGYVSTVAQSV